MTSFLGVPIIFKGKLLGNLYLNDKIGADEFSEQDEHLITMLAAQADGMRQRFPDQEAAKIGRAHV
mgnify:CR=1 FL=1